MRRSLQIIALTVIALVVVALLASHLHQRSKEEVVSHFQDQQLVVTRQAANQVESYLRDRSQRVRLLSSLASAQLPQIDVLARNIHDYFNYVKTKSVLAISVYDETGTIIYSTSKSLIGQNDAQSDFFAWARKPENKGKVYVAPLALNSIQRERLPVSSFLIFEPVEQQADHPEDASARVRVKGGISLVVDMKELLAGQLAHLSPERKAPDSWIIDENGALLFQSEHPEMLFTEKHLGGAGCNQCHTTLDYVGRILTEKQGIVDYAVGSSSKKLAAFAPIEVEDVKWIVVVTAPYDEVTAFVTRNFQETLLLLAVTILALVIGSTLVYRDYRSRVRAEEEALQWKEMRALEDKVWESEVRYRRLVELSPDTVFIESDGKIVFINAAGAKLFGATDQEQLVGTAIMDRIHPDDRAVVADRIRNLRKGAEVPLLEEKYLRLDGSSVDVEVVATPFVHRDKPAAQVIARDITERKRAEQTLRSSEEKYRRFFDEDLSGVYVCSPSGQILSCNPTFVRIFGFQSIEEALSTNVASLHQNSLSWQAFVQVLRERKKVERSEIELRRRNATAVYAILSAFGTFNEDGELLEVKCYVFDDTERKMLEGQFRQAQKMEAVGRLAGGVAHDFNNLLTAITGYSELILMRLQNSDPMHRNVEEIKKAGERAASLTRQLLAFSRRQVLQPKVLDLNAVISDMEKMIRRLIGEDIDFRFVTDGVLGRVKADRGQIEQVVMNLAVNARDAMPNGGKLTIGTSNVSLSEDFAREHRGAKPGDYVMVTVRDTGCGMNEEVQAHLFEPFFTTKEVGKGTGLGLSTVYGIVKQSGAYIDVRSAERQGTTVVIYLPQVQEDRPLLRIPPEHEGDLHGSETVLLVEDEPTVRSLGLEILRARGYTVLEAADGRSAIKICESTNAPIQLAIIDVVMPRMNGRELAQRLAILRPDIKIIFVSGYSEDAILNQGVLQPGTVFLQKPFTPDSLARKAREILDREIADFTFRAEV